MHTICNNRDFFPLTIFGCTFNLELPWAIITLQILVLFLCSVILSQFITSSNGVELNHYHILHSVSKNINIIFGWQSVENSRDAFGPSSDSNSFSRFDPRSASTSL